MQFATSLLTTSNMTCYHQAGASDANASWYRLGDSRLAATCTFLAVYHNMALIFYALHEIASDIDRSTYSAPMIYILLVLYYPSRKNCRLITGQGQMATAFIFDIVWLTFSSNCLVTVFCHNWQHSLNTPVKHLSFSSNYYFIHILNSLYIYSVHILKRTNRWNALKVENFFSCFCRETTIKFQEGFCVSSEDVLLETWQMKLMAVNSYKLIQPFRLFWYCEA